MQLLQHSLTLASSISIYPRPPQRFGRRSKVRPPRPESYRRPHVTSNSTQAGPAATAEIIADILHGAGAKLVASLPDNWIAPVIRHFDSDARFHHVPVNREESAVGLCAGAFFAGAP